MPKPVKMVDLRVRVLESLALRLKLRASLDNKSVTDLVTEALEKHVKPVPVKEIEGVVQP